MRLKFDNERVLAVVAHPDDAELLCAGTLARAKSDGAEIGICVLCCGDKGQPNPPISNLADVRSGEMQAAAELLGAQLLEGGIADGELYDATETRQLVIELYRQYRPTLVLAHADQDYHPDHRAAATLAAAASWFCASPGHSSDSPAMQAAPALWTMDTIDMIGFTPSIYVDVSEHVELKRNMLRCHKSQIDRGDHTDFLPLEPLMIRQCTARGAQAGVPAAEAFCSLAVWKRLRAW